MKKFIKVLFINLLLIALVILIVEFALNFRFFLSFLPHIAPEELKTWGRGTYIEEYFKTIKNHYGYIPQYFTNKKDSIFNYFYESDTYRTPVYSTDKKNEDIILLFGCSFTYGTNLTNEQSFHSKINKYYNRTVYNYGIPGGSPKEILFLLRNFENIKDKPTNDNIDYVIYTFIEDHERRIFANLMPIVPNFKINKEGQLEYTNSKYECLKLSFIYRELTSLLLEKYIIRNAEKRLLLYIKEINREIKNKFTNAQKETKFVVLVYRDPYLGYENFKKNLEEENITVINVKNIVNTDIHSQKYRTHDEHPNEKAWEVIVPALVKELNL